MMTHPLTRLALVPMVWLLMAAAPLVDPPPVAVPAALSQKEAMNVLRRTLITRQWLITKDAANELDGQLNVRTHSISVRFTLTPDKTFAFKYLDSTNMDYGVDRKGNPVIHRKYSGWMGNLVTALQQQLQLAQLEKSR